MADDDRTDDQTDDATETDAQGDAEGTDGTPAPLVKADGSPFTQGDLDALNEALRKARRDARATKRTAPTDADVPDTDQVARDATAAAEAKFKPVVIKAAARAAFAEAGLVKPDAVDKAIRLLDLDDIDVTPEGEVSGIDDQIADLKRDFPELFAVRTQRTKVDGADRNGPGGAKKSTAEQIAAALIGGR